MVKNKLYLLQLLLVLVLSGKLITAQSRNIKIPVEISCVDSLDESNLDILKQHLLGSSHWEYLSRYGKDYARKRYADSETKRLVHKYSDDDQGIYKGETYILFHNSLPDVCTNTRSTVVSHSKREEIAVKTFKDEFKAHPAFSSCLVFESEYFNIIVKETAKTRERFYTAQSLTDISKEFQTVLNNPETVYFRGFIEDGQNAGIYFDSLFFSIENGAVPGRYVVNGAFNLNEAGEVYIKAFEPRTGMSLSKDQLRNASRRKMGWSNNGDTYFYYEADIRIYEGAYAGPYKARFEAWFRNSDNEEIKLAESTRIIRGWNRKNELSNKN